MRTQLDCLPCFLRQALYTTRLCTVDSKVQRMIMGRVMQLLSEMDLSLTPPENSVPIYSLISELACCADPFADLKNKSNAFAIKLRAGLQKEIQASVDPVLTAVKLAIAGNIIDYGAHHVFDVKKTIENSLEQELWINNYEQFNQDINRSKNILYLGDNCGELVFDSLLIEILAKMGKKLTFAVKEKPIINDAIVSDALACRLDQYSEILSNGAHCPGTPLAHCSEYFRKKFQEADLIISKGQGNYETLSETSAPIYFLLTVKCSVVGNHISGQTGKKGEVSAVPSWGEMVIMKNSLMVS